ncbi:MAG: glycosyltransferase [Kibdelosporangium sp.]
MIRSVAVVVPARDEQSSIGACLLGIRAAVCALPPSVSATVCVVLDRCQDGTEAIARSMTDVVMNSSDSPLGGVRDIGVRRTLTFPADECWVLNTDADSVVPPDWITTHLRLAERGAHAVAGDVRLAGWDDRDDDRDESIRARYRQLVRGNRERIYGANLGLRGDVYLAVGGFGQLSTGEDQHLWDRVGLAGYRAVTTASAPVMTSSRTRGRARGGLADLLAGLRDQQPV